MQPQAAGTLRAGVERGLQLAAGALAAVGAAALAGVLLLVSAAVVMRYGWSRPLAITEELAGLLMTIAVFALMPVTVLRELHIRVSVVSGRLHGLSARLVFLGGQAILLAFCWVFVREAWAITDFTASLNLKSEQSRLPLAPFLYLATASVAMTAVAGLWRTLYPVAPDAGSEVSA